MATIHHLGFGMIHKSTSENWFCGLVLVCEQHLGPKKGKKRKTKNHTRVTFHTLTWTTQWGDSFEFGMQGDNTEAITHTKCCINW